MIDIRELRIGNYITDQWNSTYTSIESINKEGIGLVIEDDGNWPECASRWIEPIIRIDEIFGIPLTEEILLGCGYKREVENFFVNDKASDCSVFLYSYGCNLAVGYNEYSIGEGLKYLHQLQNLCFDLTGTELEIKL